MSKFVSALFLSLMPFLAYAADVHEPVGMIVAFFVYMWIKQRDKKEGDPS
jgi:uncharacterized protein YfaQ (DUF2300 family)